MLPRVVDVEPLEGYVLRISFHDGVVTEVDLSGDLWGEMFEPLNDPAYFAQVGIDPMNHTVVWPNGLDLDPAVLHGDFPPASGGWKARVIEPRSTA